MSIQELARKTKIKKSRIYDLARQGLIPPSIIQRQKPGRRSSYQYEINETEAPSWLIAFQALWEIGLEDKEIPPVLKKVPLDELREILRTSTYPQFIKLLQQRGAKVALIHFPMFLSS